MDANGICRFLYTLRTIQNLTTLLPKKDTQKSNGHIRPNVSSLNSVTENISSFVDYWLQLLVKQLPSFIKHTKEFVDLITTTQIPLNSTLVSIDVSSLYTNTPHKDGITSSINALKWDQNPHPLWPPIEFWRKC